jgi:hypothetical protein
MTEFLIQYGELFSIIMFFIPPMLSVLILYFIKRNWIWMSIPITIMVDLLVWGKALLESSHGRVSLVFLIPQVTIIAIISFLIRHDEKRKKKYKTIA